MNGTGAVVANRAAHARWRACSGGVTGRDHRLVHRDGQDGHAVVMTSDVTAAIVTDGCSSGRASEVGARLGARWLAELITREANVVEHDEQREQAAVSFAARVTSALIERVEIVARSLSRSGELDAAVATEMLLFGFLAAAVVRDDFAIVFGVGDGFAWVDGEATVIDPGPENAPVYAAYGLFGRAIEPRILHVSPASAVGTIAVGTDGVLPLLEDREAFGALVRDERLPFNPSLLRKRLLVLSDRALFWDDASLGLVVRNGAER